jgi:methylglutaconyl-CoA hydratase
MTTVFPMSTLQIDFVKPGVARITMNRPDVFNAFDEAMIEEIDATYAKLEAEANVRVIVLAGAGKHFSAGADLKWMQRASEASFAWNVADARKFADMLFRISNCSKPTVARVQGAALGGGVGLTCACDIAIAADNASFAVSEAKFGILPSVIGPHVINAVGKRHATRLALTTTRIGAAEALAMGMVQQVVALGELDAAVDQCVDELLAASPNAQREIKLLFTQLEQQEITPQVLDLTSNTIARVRGTQEAKEGFAAFLEKRPAPWMLREL